jgi:hypothetical protein
MQFLQILAPFFDELQKHYRESSCPEAVRNENSGE